MAKTEKKKTSYRKLLEKVHEFCKALHRPEHIHMWTYTEKELAQQWSLFQVHERVAAAQQLGWNVELKVNNGTLEIWYIKLPKIPCDWLYL